MRMQFLKEKEIENFLKKNKGLSKILKKLSLEEKKIIFSLIKIGQGERIFKKVNINDSFVLIKKMLTDLLKVDLFYKDIGGIVGYYKKALDIKNIKKKEDIKIFNPPLINIFENSKIKKYIAKGIESLPFFCKIYPMGGVGDRLNHIDEKTKKPLPVASFNFLGKTLLQHLMEELKANENLFFKIYNKKINIPVIIMTSEDKNNHSNIISILEDNKWFQKGKDNFFIFKQFLSPVIDENGNWVLEDKLKLLLKPSGHGVIWKLMKDNKVFDWLYKKKVQKGIVRQINNPIAGFDYSLLAFMGYGVLEDKKFGVASCSRKMQSQEGVNVLKKEGKKYFLSNIEYTDFERCNIPIKGKKFLKFPSNTNILFVDLKEIERVVDKSPFPGMVLNMKNKAFEGNKKIKAGRLELMMQNISEGIYSEDKKKLNTFLTYNKREKTISCIKRKYDEKKYLETPLSCFYDFQKNYFDLLKNYSKIKISKIKKFEDFIKKDLCFFCYLSPSIGPLFEDIAKKIRRGEIRYGSEMQIEIAEIEIKNIYLDGSMLILKGDQPGVKRALLKNVKIINKGIDKSKKNSYITNKIHRKESFKIVLKGNSCFEAKDVTFVNDYNIIVEDGIFLKAYEKDKKVFFEKKFLF
ncbi:MAG: hypothetical protein AMS24_00095 [Chlamydiae bacterium SM23_39]|nr:MAG: hypothetical protein AMS24_00095 [Chlamydiae bacterium SM23_39]